MVINLKTLTKQCPLKKKKSQTNKVLPKETGSWNSTLSSNDSKFTVKTFPLQIPEARWLPW